MKPMIWHPEPHDHKVNQYLDKQNREPWLEMIGISLLLMLVITTLILVGAF